MNMLTLKIPEELDAVLRDVSRARGLPKSVVVREALEQSLSRHVDQAGAAERWASQWRGRLKVASAKAKGKAEQHDERLAHLMAKHVR